MLPCARTCASRQLRHSTNPTTLQSLPDQPLFFLYPRWAWTEFRLSRRTYRHATHNEIDIVGVGSHDCTSPSERERNVSRDALPITKRDAQFPQPQIPQRIAPDPPKSVQLGTRGRRRGRKIDGTSRGENCVVCTTTKSSESHTKPVYHNAATLNGLIVARKLAGISKSIPQLPNERIRVSKEFLNWLVGTATQNMWLYEATTTCKVAVLAPADRDQEYREITFTGSKTAQEEAAVYLAERIEDFRLEQEMAPSTQETTSASENNVTSTFATSQVLVYEHVDDIPTPQTWSLKTFYDYVRTVVGSRAPKAVERAIYAKSKGFDHAATGALLRAFSAPELRFCQSSAALRLIIENFRQRTHLATIGQIWNIAVQNGLVPDIQSYNFELQRCFALKNSERIHYLVWTMEINQVKPDLATWALLLKMLSATSQRRKIVKALVKSKQIVTAEDQDILVRGLIQADFQEATIQQDGIPRFADWLQRVFGENWLSPGAVSDMVLLCIRSRSSWKIHEVLDIARYFGISLDKVDSVALLEVLRRTRHFGDTMSFFKAVLLRDHSVTAQSQLELLFKTAWSQRLYNTCRLIWRFCASHGMINYAMQRLIVTNLAMNHGVKTDQSYSKPSSLSWLAAITIGTDTEIDDFEQKFPLLSLYGWTGEPATILCQWQPNDARRHEQLQLAHLLLERDLNASSVFKAMRHESFFKQLSTAFAIDLQWRKMRLVEQIAVSELASLAIKVGLRRQSATRGAQTDANKSHTTSLAKEATSLSTRNLQPHGMKIMQHGIGEALEPPCEAREPSCAKSQHLYSSSLSPTTFNRYTLAPAMALTSGSLLDILFQHLQGAIGTY